MEDIFKGNVGRGGNRGPGAGLADRAPASGLMQIMSEAALTTVLRDSPH